MALERDRVELRKPPVSDDWKPRRKVGKKPFGIRMSVTYRYGATTNGPRERTYTFIQWYATERARQDAVTANEHGGGMFGKRDRQTVVIETMDGSHCVKRVSV